MLLLKEKHVLVLHETIQGSDFPSPFPHLPPPPPLSINNYENKISPSILLIIVILAVIFFISGVLHLLVRFLLRPTARDPESSENATALQGQLQELFHLHDAGVDQSFIDTLPVFQYKTIIGLKDPFDCAVCLCEFEPEDKLRLLPKCSHAFHIECIDTWLLSHSTCPLCRRSLFSDFSSPVNNSCSPIVLLLESGIESSREILASNREEIGQNSHLGFAGEAGEAVVDEKVVPVKLGKFKNVDVGGEGGGEGSSSSCNGKLEQNQRRCFSMGSYEYVMDQSCMLQVAVKPVKKKLSIKRPGNRAAMSECDCHWKREGFKVLGESKSSELRADGSSTWAASATSLQRRESFSISKIWLRQKGEKTAGGGGDSSRRAFSFHLPLQEELDLGDRKDKGGSEEEDLDVEVGSCVNSFGSQIEETPSFARRTLLWIVGRQNKVGIDHQNVLN